MLTLAARSLGELAMPSSCPRCFWIQEKLQGKPPFQIGMPGIFREIDSHAKQLVRSALDRGGELPPWFPELGPIALPEEALDWRVFSHHDEATGIELRGVPDEVFRLADGSYHIVDYKTARITDRQDELFPLAQLNAYAFIAGGKGYTPVSGLSLLYLEPKVGMGLNGEELILAFQAVRREVVLNQGMIRGLLQRAQELLSLEGPPAGRVGCEDCRQLGRLLELLELEGPPF
jgi:hypothetical protein